MTTAGSLRIGKSPELMVSPTPGTFLEVGTPENRGISSKYNTRSTPEWHVDFTQHILP
jgi:hypothetical protein